eukprot:UN17058
MISCVSKVDRIAIRCSVSFEKVMSGLDLPPTLRVAPYDLGSTANSRSILAFACSMSSPSEYAEYSLSAYCALAYVSISASISTCELEESSILYLSYK